MALSLSAPLLAAQTAVSRRPIVEMSAGRLGNDFPLVGKPFANPDPITQALSFTLFLSDGRLATFYANVDIHFAAGDDLLYVYTDTDVTSFSSPVIVDSNDTASYTYLDGTLQPGGNIVVAAQYGTDVLTFYTVSPTGTKLTETGINVVGALGVSAVKTASAYSAIYFQLTAAVYYVYKIDSSDCVTWGAASQLTIPGLNNDVPIKNPILRRLSDGSYFLIFAYASVILEDSTLYNIGYSTSTDLTTWTALAAITTNADINIDYIFPDLVQRADDSLFITVQEDNSYLTMDSSTTGWQTTAQLAPHGLHVDDTNGKLYVTAVKSDSYAGGHGLNGMAKIDLTTWTIDKFYDANTTPPIPTVFFSENIYSGNHLIGEGSKTVSILLSLQGVVVADFDTDTITDYYFMDLSAQWGSSAAQNVTHNLDDYLYGSWGGNWGQWYIMSAKISGTKLWLGLANGHPNALNNVAVGYLDLTDVAAPYIFTLIGRIEYDITAGYEHFYNPIFTFYPDENLCLICGGDTQSSVPFAIMNLTDGTYTVYDVNLYINFPYEGFTNAVYVDSTIYAVVNYTSLIQDEYYKWGLCELNPDTGHTEYHYPPWELGPVNNMWDMVVNEATYEIIIRTTYGAVVFNYVAKTWTQLENRNFDGLPPSGLKHAIAYSPTLDIFFYGGVDSLYYVPRSGAIQIIRYITGTFGAVTWGFEAPELLAIGNFNTNPRVADDPNGILYFTWTNVSGTADTIYWDKQEAYIILNEYLVGEITTEFTAEGDPNRLKFTVTHGHLFDPHNDSSLLRLFLEKGKKILLRYGETVDDVDYWVNQGYFIINSQSVVYERDNYPLMEVTAEDERYLWGLHQVPAMNLTAQTPEDALVTVITDNTEILAEDITVPAMDLSFEFDAQWIDSYLQDIIDDISHRFQHFCIMDMDGNVEFRPFAFSAGSSNTHQPAQAIRFMIDDTYSDLTNRYTVTGQSQYDFQTLFAEERVGSLRGTVGWYGYKKDFTVYYSEDKSRRCQYPRLEVLESSTSILFKLVGQITERIIDEDPDSKYCIVEVKAPNLIPILIAGIAIYLIGNVIGDFVGFWMTIPFGRIIEGIGLYIVMMVLGSIGNYQYAIHAQPVGYIKREYSASADDLELQTEAHQITEQKIEGFVAYSTTDCQTIADFELSVAQAQRSRIKVEKIAHLQDEVGDIVSVVHPYTGATKRIFVASLTRRYKQSEGIDDGYFIDEIEGWVV